MLSRITAHNLNKQFHNTDAAPLPPGLIRYTDRVIQGLHRALIEQTQPAYRRPEHPIDGWGLTSTPLYEQGAYFGIPTLTILGNRAIYLSQQPETIHRVLTVPDTKLPFADKVLQVRDTTIPQLLAEDPTLYPALIETAAQNVSEFKLDYQIPPAPAHPHTA